MMQLSFNLNVDIQTPSTHFQALTNDLGIIYNYFPFFVSEDVRASESWFVDKTSRARQASYSCHQHYKVRVKEFFVKLFTPRTFTLANASYLKVWENNIPLLQISDETLSANNNRSCKR
jgi:hypothetical protein